MKTELNSGYMNLLSNNNIHLIEMDCIEWMDSQKEESIDVVITSPPYNINANYLKYNDNKSEESFLSWMSDVAKSLKRVLKKDGHIFLNVGYTNILPWQAIDIANEFRKYFILQNQITWVKHIVVHEQSYGQFKPITSQRFITPTTEFIFHFTHSGEITVDKMAIGHRNKTHANYPELYTEKRHIATVRRSLARAKGFKDWEAVKKSLNKDEMAVFQEELKQELDSRPFDSNKKSDLGNAWFIPYEPTSKLSKKLGESGSERSKARGSHTATFPEELPRKCLTISEVPKGSIVYDPFVGTGTTGVVAMKSDMVFYGTDIDEYYLDFSKKRIAKEIENKNSDTISVKNPVKK